MNRQFAFPLFLSAVLAAPAAAGTQLIQKWAVTPSDPAPPDYIAGTGNTERGMGYNPVTNRLVLATRAGGNRVIVLNADTGELLHTLDTSGISGGTFALSSIDVADDGKVYASNLSTSTPPALRIYRWNTDDETVPDPDNPGSTLPNTPVPIFVGDPSGGAQQSRWGDSFDVAGGGANTRIILGAGTGAVPGACIFTTEDGDNFTPLVYPLATETGDSRGICFGAGNTFYSKASGSTKKLRYSSYDPVAGTSAVLQDFTVANNSFAALGCDIPGNLLAAFEFHATNADKIFLFDITDKTTVPVLLDSEVLPPTPNLPNANGVGAVAFGGGKLFVLNTNNGITAYEVEITAEIIPPTVTAAPANRTAYLRGQTTFAVTASGTPPLAYQWFKDDVLIPSATASSLTLNPITEADAGAYKCRVTNGNPTAAESGPATLTTIPSTDSAALTPGWRIAPGGRPWLSASDTERGMDYSAVTNRLYVVSRSPTTTVRVINADDGADFGQLDMSAVSLPTGATFLLNSIGVDNDGAIYAASLTTSGTGFRIYKWANDNADTIAETVYDGTPGALRLGDSIDVRGGGANVQILAGSRNNKAVVVFNWNPDNLLFDPYVIETGSADGAFGICARFGEGDTVWGKNGGGSMTRASFDITTLTGAVLNTFPTSNIPGTVGAFALELTAGSLVALQLDNSDNTRLYQLPTPLPDPAPATLELLDQEFLVTDNTNVNATGAVAVSGSRAWVLDTGNGISSYTIVKPAAAAPPEITDVTLSGGNVVFTLKGTPGKTYLIEKSTALSPAAAWTADGTVTPAAAAETITRAVDPGQPRLFWRAKEQ